MKNLKSESESEKKPFIAFVFVVNSYFRFLLYYSSIKIISSTSLNDLKEEIVKKQKKKNIMLLSLHLTFNL